MLREMMVKTAITIAALTETHLSPTMLAAEVDLEGYQLYRADSANGRLKGRAAVLVGGSRGPN